MKIINAENSIIGRIATIAAKSALLGKDIIILNCDKAVVTGSKQEIIAKFKRKISMGTPSKGPFFPKRSDRIMKRVIRGMLPYKQYKGRNAYERIKCYNGIPDEFADKPIETINEANIKKIPNLKYLYIDKISKVIGAK